jgi:2-methylcitrate dehydratase PrpD
MGPTETLARFIIETRFDDIPNDVVERARELATNVLGVTVGGATQPTGRIAIDLVREQEAKPRATVIGAGFKSSPILAALANGNSAHALDYDDSQWSPLCHPTVVTLPTALTTGEVQDASGRDVLAAYIVGTEVEMRIGEAATANHYTRGWHSTGTLGALGAAAVAAKLLGLDVGETRIALGIAASSSSGLRANSGTMTKPLHAGLASQGGLQAALLAQRGFVARPDVLEHELGFFNAFNGEGRYDLAEIDRELGSRWCLLSPGLTIKPSPANTGVGIAVYGTLELVRQHGIAVDEVERVEVGANPIIPTTLPYTSPRTDHEAKYSMQHGIAVAMLDGRGGVKQFTEERVADPQLRALYSRVHLYVHPELQEVTPDRYAALHVRVVLKDERRHEGWFEHARGAPDAPYSWDDLRARYRECASLTLPAEKVERTLQMAEQIDQIPRIADLLEALNP